MATGQTTTQSSTFVIDFDDDFLGEDDCASVSMTMAELAFMVGMDRIGPDAARFEDAA